MTRRTGITLLAAWAILLIASQATSPRRADPPPAQPGQHTVIVPGVPGGPPVLVRYRKWGPDTGVPLLLLHGSPGSGGVFGELGPQLAAGRPVLAPDLPGFGRSSYRIPDYSIAAHAQYVASLLDSLAIDSADVVGFSLGGGVALELAHRNRTRVRSLTLLSSIGVQEYELLGDYWLNHAIHGLQLGCFWALRNLVPHFGVFGAVGLDHAYARNFYDTDQRPLREILDRWDGPLLILHGENDPLVPAAAAREHFRIVPQSRLVMLDGDHFMTFLEPERLAVPLDAFLADVADGHAATRATAAPERTLRAAAPFDPTQEPSAHGFAVIVAVLLIAAATLVSEDLTCIAAGLLVARGSLALNVAIVACLLGIWIGDLLLFAAGRTVGRAVIRLPLLRRLVTAEDVARASEWFKVRGGRTILLSRFIPGMRLPTYVAAGVLHIGFWWSAWWFFVAALIWTPLLVGGTALLGRAVGVPSWPWLLGLWVLFWFLLRVLIPLATWRGRRLLRGSWLRLTRWEFWPMWAVYWPIALYVLWLGVRHRGLTTFTAANPGLPGGGGFVGESKWDTLRQLPVRANGGGTSGVVPTGYVPAGDVTERLDRIRQFVEREHLAFPIVLKPDVGERGTDVVMAESWDEVERYCARVTGDVLVQARAMGREFGVFWHRAPGDRRGAIFSITTKRLPTVVADGHRTLEDLILADDRAVAQSRVFLRRFAGRLLDVPPAGATVPLDALGNHCRGAAFFDGTDLATPALAETLDSLSAHIAGFAVGRYDVIVPDVEALQAGRDIAVIEVNGTSSEATSIYDPSHSLLDAWRTLAAQWRLLFAIGSAQRALGARPTGSWELLRAVVRWMKRPDK